MIICEPYFLSIAVKPLKHLHKYLQEKLGIFLYQKRCDHFRNFFDPHVTIAYLPINKKYLENLIDPITRIIHGYLPMEIHYNTIYVSNYNSVNISVNPKDLLIEIHCQLFKQMFSRSMICGEEKILDSSSERELLELFGTTNIFRRYSPHLTIEKFESRETALEFFDRLYDFLPCSQYIEFFQLLDASRAPLRQIREIS